EIQPEIQCRVLLTAPMESFSVGHTIVVSRGLLDVLPDEATLAAVLAHEMSHILLAHGESPMYGFNDRMLFNERQTFTRLTLSHSPAEEQAADTRALELLKNSPYKEQLANAGLFLRALQQRSPVLPNLIRAHLGNGLTLGSSTRMSQLIASAPALEMNKVDQIAALPLGARIKVDPWSDSAQMSKAKPVALLSAREKMFFEVTPVYPYLTRVNDKPNVQKVATTSPAQ
ncbi:MAG TPA: M48 family metalloprotease, partial [Terriglobales bacterium]|nr:M48 family metalloprotease [Terriglobales bacterium]